MKQPPKRDYQTASFFIILAMLTAVLVLGYRWWLVGSSIKSAAQMPPDVVEAVRR